MVPFFDMSRFPSFVCLFVIFFIGKEERKKILTGFFFWLINSFKDNLISFQSIFFVILLFFSHSWLFLLLFILWLMDIEINEINTEWFCFCFYAYLITLCAYHLCVCVDYLHSPTTTTTMTTTTALSIQNHSTETKRTEMINWREMREREKKLLSELNKNSNQRNR